MTTGKPLPSSTLSQIGALLAEDIFVSASAVCGV